MNDGSRHRKKTMRHDLTAAILNAVFPRTCLVCGAFYHDDSFKVDGGFSQKKTGFNGSYGPPFPAIDIDNLFAPYICGACASEIVLIEPPFCVQCGIMFDAREGENHLCGTCLKDPKPYGMARAAGIYEKTCMALIHAFKYRGKIQLAAPLGTLLLNAFLKYWSYRDIDLMVPVPLHKRRFRERGFNQAYLIAGKMLDRLKEIHPGAKNITLAGNGLIRARSTHPQTGLGRRERIDNVKQVFRVNDRIDIDQKAILLIDDVYTTGATADACATALLNGGAGRVDVLTLARAM